VLQSRIDVVSKCVLSDSVSVTVLHTQISCNKMNGIDKADEDDQWRYSPDRALASLYGFHDSL
jgi:hypothetical protein